MIRESTQEQEAWRRRPEGRALRTRPRGLTWEGPAWLTGVTGPWAVEAAETMLGAAVLEGAEGISHLLGEKAY